MSLSKEFKTDKTREQSGIKYERGGARLTLARAGGANAQFAAQAERNRREKGKALATMDAEGIRAITCEMYSRHVVRKWETLRNKEWIEGIENPDDEDGDLLPDTVENRIKLFELYPEFLDEVVEMSNNFALFRAGIVSDITKN